MALNQSLDPGLGPGEKSSLLGEWGHLEVLLPHLPLLCRT